MKQAFRSLIMAGLMLLILPVAWSQTSAPRSSGTKQAGENITPVLKLMDSPRLYVTAEVAANLEQKLHSPFLKSLEAQVLQDADRLVHTAPLKEGEAASWQAGTRSIDSRLQCLTAAWVLTRNERYRQAAIKHLDGLLQWNQISCETNTGTPAEPILPFCLSYGELANTTGLMYDLFRPAMTEAEKQVFKGIFNKFLLKAALNCLTDPPWWANKEWSNWNGVCAGGMGVMALALYDDMPEAQKLIPFVEQSLGEYFKSYITNGGGCPEGTGYWNYGMTFAIRYLLSWENATGKNHPALEINELGQALFFPVDFTGITFGDNDGWGPMSFYFMLARRMNQPNAAMRAAAYLIKPLDLKIKRPSTFATTGDLLYAADLIPAATVMEQIRQAHEKVKVPVARVYSGMEWAVLADDEAFPRLRLSVRGGSNKFTGHGMIDLLSVRCRVNGELMITDAQGESYMPTTFGKRGHEIYGRSAASKSTLFVDGLGCHTDVTCDKTEVVQGKDILGIRIDGSHIYIPGWKNIFIGRLVLMVENSYWLVIDNVFSPNPVDGHWAESRFHTYVANKQGKDWVALKSGKERMMLSCAALGPAVLRESRSMPSNPAAAPTTIFRWMGETATNDNLHVVALNPGQKKLSLKVWKQKDGVYAIEITRSDGRKRTICLTADLKLS
jgi:hypothetical protein